MNNVGTDFSLKRQGKDILMSKEISHPIGNAYLCSTLSYFGPHVRTRQKNCMKAAQNQ